MAAATKELMWLNEKEEEEVGFDWSDRNTNMAAKKESYSVRQPSLHRAPFPLTSMLSPTVGGPLSSVSGLCEDGRGTCVAFTAFLKLSLTPFSFLSGPDA